jgi:hypothetical protein
MPIIFIFDAFTHLVVLALALISKKSGEKLLLSMNLYLASTHFESEKNNY